MFTIAELWKRSPRSQQTVIVSMLMDYADEMRRLDFIGNDEKIEIICAVYDRVKEEDFSGLLEEIQMDLDDDDFPTEEAKENAEYVAETLAELEKASQQLKAERSKK